jgi:hypothetical protein
MKNKNIIQEAEKTLGLLNQFPKVKAGNDFYFNLQNRINATPESTGFNPSTLKWQLAVVSFLFIVNLTFLGSFMLGSDQQQTNYADSVVSEYSLDVQTLYENTNE